MVRTFISLPQADKRWLDLRAKRQGVSMTAVIREAVASLRANEARQVSLDRVLAATKGIWRKGDGLAWQRKMRAEWR